MRPSFSPTTGAGVVSGLLFYAAALIPNGVGWPLLLPLAGGAAAMVAARRRGEPAGVLSTGLRTGAIAGAVFLVLTLPTLYLLSRGDFAPVLRPLSGDAAPVLTGVVMLTLVLVGASAPFTATLGALLGLPFGRPHTVSRAPA